jgi:hypothetical protein
LIKTSRPFFTEQSSSEILCTAKQVWASIYLLAGFGRLIVLFTLFLSEIKYSNFVMFRSGLEKKRKLAILQER